MVVTEPLSLSSITIESESLLNVEKLLQSLNMWYDAPDSKTHFGASVVARVQAVG